MLSRGMVALKIVAKHLSIPGLWFFTLFVFFMQALTKPSLFYLYFIPMLLLSYFNPILILSRSILLLFSLIRKIDHLFYCCFAP